MADSTTDLLLLHPPVALPAEPPVGVATLLGALRRRCRVAFIDANVEALHHLLALPGPADCVSTAERRALSGRERALEALRHPLTYRSVDRHRAAIFQLETLLRLARPDPPGTRVRLADFHQGDLSPLSSVDCRRALRGWEQSPFASYLELLRPRVAALAPRVIGISVSYLHQVLPALALAGALHQRLPRTPILLGGAIWRGWTGRLPGDAFCPEVAGIVVGDGARPLGAALGLSPPAASDSGDPAPPDCEGAPWSLYLAPERVVPLSSSSGCPWARCRYCPEATTGEPFRPLSPERLPQLVDLLRERHQADLLHLTDSAVPLPTLTALSRQRWSARWYGFARFYPELAGGDLAPRLARAGCTMLQLGLESGSPRVLGRLRKGIDPGQASVALRRLADAGIAVYLYVMFGIPGERREDAERTLDFVVDHVPCITFINTSLLNLPRQSPPEPDLTTIPLSGADHDLGLYSGFVSREGWDRRQARRFLEREFQRHPRVAPILARTPTVFGPSHAPFFLRHGG